MPNYYFTLSGSQMQAYNLQNLDNEDFRFQTDHRSEDPVRSIFISYCVDVNDTPDVVVKKSRHLLALINGGRNIETRGSQFSRISLDWLIDWDKEEQVNLGKIDDSEIIDPFVSVNDPISKATAVELRDRNFLLYAIYLAKHDYFIKSLLLLASQPYSFVVLYCILDTIRTTLYDPSVQDKKLRNKIFETKFKELCRLAGTNEEEINVFTGTANNFGLLGLQSRHGELGFKQPKNSMNLTDSCSLMFNLTFNALQYHFEIEGIK